MFVCLKSREEQMKRPWREGRIHREGAGRGSRQLMGLLCPAKMEQSVTRIIDSFACGFEITICTGKGEGGEEKNPHSTAFSIQ